MKYSCYVIIDLPIEKVVSLFEDSANMVHWQQGFQSYEPLEGIPGREGSTALIRYDLGSQQLEMVETVLVNDLPREFMARYEYEHGTNTMQNIFEEHGNGQTRWVAHLDYFEIRGMMMKIMKWFAPRVFRKQTQAWMNKFKEFSEDYYGANA